MCILLALSIIQLRGCIIIVIMFLGIPVSVLFVCFFYLGRMAAASSSVRMIS